MNFSPNNSKSMGNSSSSESLNAVDILQSLFNTIQTKLDDIYQKSSPNSHHLPLFPVCRYSYLMSMLLMLEKIDENEYEAKLDNFISKIQDSNSETVQTIEKNGKKLCQRCNSSDSFLFQQPSFFHDKLKKVEAQKAELENEIKSLENINNQILKQEIDPRDLSIGQIEFERIQCEHILAVSNARSHLDQLSDEISALEIALSKVSSLAILHPPSSLPGDRNNSPRFRRATNNYNFQIKLSNYINLSHTSSASPRNKKLSPAQIRQISLEPLSPIPEKANGAEMQSTNKTSPIVVKEPPRSEEPHSKRSPASQRFKSNPQ
ncbi:hypothetical protein TRFO_01797 [Tritrichomonas foetus]|uniref:Uncharacterized protein n=1 Tax=Tritrichomonas foetus TaxID=1144522 RepID=A0A1J4JMK1_9EUKA|nr:hypothetical protein TRFO_01797 [Tritrichomonas foetus]|eukprot:OHS98763.1 hypothetical protein TRFO_01797 [Tritrichomonas foetus]